MRSLVRQRRAAEWLLRMAAVLALLAALYRLLEPPVQQMNAAAAGTAGLANALAVWTDSPAPETLRVTLDSAPEPRTRDWLRALAHAGGVVEWRLARPIEPLVVAAAAVRSPRGGTRIAVAASPAAPRVLLSDAAGAIDSLTPNDGGAVLEADGVSRTILASAGGAVARVETPNALTPRPVLVLARAGWEGKFVVAALEEDGWTVRARFAVAPGIDVAQGDAPALDTAHLSAVVVLDSALWPELARVDQFVRSGGGLVIGGSGALTPSLGALRPGAAAVEEPGVAGALSSANPRRGLPLLPVSRLTSDAIPIERRGTSIAAAARRVGAGRVVQVGYDESWRWRLAGDDGAPAAHRRWWSNVVASAAYAPAPLPNDSAGLGAPYARLVAALGPPSTAVARGAPPTPSRRLPWWLFVIPVAGLLIEWGSRRLRGAP
jgi:hypothetical protein